MGRALGSGAPPEGFSAEMLAVVEVDADGRIAYVAIFDEDDLDAARADYDALVR